MKVSWVRHRDIHLLTVGRDTYTSDQRFQAVHKPRSDEWMLQIKYPQVNHTINLLNFSLFFYSQNFIILLYIYTNEENFAEFLQ